MSLVCFPFKEEDVAVVKRNLEIAASHPRVARILCVGYSQGETWHAIEAATPGIEASTKKKVILVQQKRIGGLLRGGKGDGMNSALSYFLDHTELSRIHFYDADIVSFSWEWIEKAEKQADLGFDIVRHYFPRSSTDAMITWFVTKIGFSLLWPNSVLPHVEQPLGGELLFTRRAAKLLWEDERVRAQSDWGIDTLYTFVIAQRALHMAEVYIVEGKVHALYGGLRDLKTMLVECFHAIQSLKAEAVPQLGGLHRVEVSRPAPNNVREKIGYDIEKTLKLLAENWTPRQKQLLEQHFESSLAKGLVNASKWPQWGFCDEEAWVNAYGRFLEHFEKGDSDWEELLFKVWVSRVLNHTIRHVIRGYDVALSVLRDMVRDTQHSAAVQLREREKAAAAAAEQKMSAGHSVMEGHSDRQLRSTNKKPRWMDGGAEIITM